MSTRELMRHLGDTTAKVTRGRKIGRRRGNCRTFVDIRLGADTEPEPETVQLGL